MVKPMLLLMIIFVHMVFIRAYVFIYNTDRYSETDFEYDCIDYEVSDDILLYKVESIGVSQTIRYCLRPSYTIDDNVPVMEVQKLHRSLKKFTFEQLRFKLQITADNLLSIPGYTSIDIIERYKIYFQTLDESMSQEEISLCEGTWFGSECQYIFNIHSAIHMRLDSIEPIYLDHLIWERPSNISAVEMTCYTHLICNRGPPPACLDWREICDGKIDCANDDGIDERFCEQFEILKCNTSEYRCRNGRQCIPKEFYRDDPLNPDCQDGSDEIIKDSNKPLTYPNECDRDPSFRCEERTCPSKRLACGDGQCVEYFHQCYNHRGQLLMMEFAIYSDYKSLDSCRYLPISCGTHIDNIDNCETSCWGKKMLLCEARLGQSCLSTVFKHSPAIFRPNDDMYIFYDYNEIPPKKPWIIVPHDNCYNDTFCDNTEIYSDNPYSYWCQRHQHRMRLTYVGSYSRSDFNATIQRLTKKCYGKSYDSNNSHEFLYQSENTSRSISDRDQFEATSEHNIYDIDRYKDNSLRNKQNRIKSGYDEIWESIKAYEAYKNQRNALAKYNWTEEFPFSKLCDRHEDLNATIIDGLGQTDETECDYWPCNNVYTRCTDHKNCPNGTDELMCTKIHCHDDEFLCLSIHSNKTECLSKKRFMDSKIDCIGGTDEYLTCNRSFNSTVRPFLCSSNNQCIDIKFVCDGITHCIGGEDEYFCQSFAIIMVLSMLHCESYVASIDKHSMILSCFNNTFKSTNFLSMMNLMPYPIVKSESLTKSLRLKRTDERQILSNKNLVKISRETNDFYCNRGLDAYVATSYDKNLFERKCFCSPSYYGNRCQYQTDRISLTLRMLFSFNQRNDFVFLIILTDENRHRINSFIIHKHYPSEDCDTKLNSYLLYSFYMKNKTMNYFLHIDLFKQEDLSYYTSWKISILSFLPVTRIALLLRIPVERSLSVKNNSCDVKCQHGQCMKYVNIEKYFCQCQSGWHGLTCNIMEYGECSSHSLYMGSANNRPICLCRSHQFGPRCLFNSPCQTAVCQNGGTCISLVDLKHDRQRNRYRCVCTNEFEGKHCEQQKSSISFEFVGIPIYSFMIIHIFSKFTNESRTQSITFKKLRTNSNIENIFISSETDINLIFVQLDRRYYLVIVRENNPNSLNISTIVTPKRRCYHISDLLNSTVVRYHSLRRLKYYPRLCFERRDLVCFHDKRLMCLCTMDYFSNCFEFDYNKNCTCQEENPCEKEGRCFQDRPQCPSIVQCICSECYYGSRCQFSTSGLGISLDAILGYEIQPINSLSKQFLSVKISAIITMIMFIFGLLSNIMSLMTFRQGQSRKVGCGQYLLASSIASLLTMIMFVLKFWFLFLTQMSIITHPTFLFLNCLLMDNLTKVCLAISNWFGACVAIERTISIIQKIKFNRRRSKQMAIRIILIIIFSVVLSNLPDPLHRVLLHDETEKRIWCIVRYPPSVETFNSINIFLHFVAPFAINAISAMIIIVATARTRSGVKKEESYLQHLFKQLQQLKHLLISPSVLVLLSIPRLMLAFIPGCMKSTEDLWIYLAGFFISFVPPVLIFPIFVLPSRLYRKEFNNQAKILFNAITKYRR